MSTSWDVIVAGAGPAGAASAAFLARRGNRVLVLEKELFPRFRIGESLLPACLPVLERLELQPTEKTYVYKHGAEFVCEATGRAQVFGFEEALPGCPHHAWHVVRARFDAELADRAAAWGAEIRFGQAVSDVEIRDREVRVRTPAGTETARYFIDASGQNRLLARRMESVEPYERFGMSAVFTHFEKLGPAYSEVFGDTFDIRIMVRSEGWGWIIPLPENRLSVGIASTGKVTPEHFDEGLLAGPLMQKLSAGARRLETHVVGNFGYKNTAPHGARYATAGDASAFLDPVFSSGVTLALRGAADMTDLVGEALESGSEHDPHLLDAHQASMTRAYATFGALIERFYHTRFADSFFLQESPSYEMRRGIMSVLAGDVWREDNPFQEMLLKGRRRPDRHKTASRPPHASPTQ